MGGVSRKTVQDFYEAYASRDPMRIEACLADDVQWHMVGSAELFQFCGLRRGKAEVVDYFGRLFPQVFAVRRVALEEVVIDADRAALFSKAVAVKRDTGRIISYRSALFAVFEHEKVASLQGIAYTFDIAEQMVGHRIDPYWEASLASFPDLAAS